MSRKLARIGRVATPLAIAIALHLSPGLSATPTAVQAVSPLSSAPVAVSAAFSGAIYTTDSTGVRVNQNLYGLKTSVYLSGGPQNANAAGLPNGTYYFQVTDPSGKVLLSQDNAVCRQLLVTAGRVTGAVGSCPHSNGTFNPSNGTTPVQLAPFATTPNPGGEYKAWLIRQTSGTSISSSNPKVINFKNSDSKTDNFKVVAEQEVPPGTCQPSSSMSVLVSGANVTSYVPKGCWSCGASGVSVVNVEGVSITPTLIPTIDVVNSCASNSTSGQTVCSSNGTDVYLFNGTSLTGTLTSGGSGFIGFSGGSCTTCGVAMGINQAVLTLSVAGAPGFQFLNLGTSTFEPPLVSPSGMVSENPLIDPIRNLLLSAAENNTYEIANVSTSTSPQFFENPLGPLSGVLDSSGEDCQTGIVLAPIEFSGPSQVFIGDISNPTFAPFTPGSPGNWTAPSQVQSLSGSFLSAGASGIAVAQGTHTGVVSGEFGGDAITAIALPATSGGGAVPAIADWVTCSIGGGFMNGLDPHTITAYRSPNGANHAIALLADLGATTLAVVDLTAMLDSTIVPRNGSGDACAAGTLPATVVSFVGIP